MPTRTAEIKKSTLNVGKDVELAELSFWECENGTIILKKWEFLKKLNMHISYDPKFYSKAFTQVKEKHMSTKRPLQEGS